MIDIKEKKLLMKWPYIQRARNMSFGGVYQMRFNTFFIFSIFIYSQFSYAVTWEDFLKSKMDKSYLQLEEKMDHCDSHQNFLPKITDDWFMNLSKDEKYAAASYLEYLADVDCFGKELRTYESNLLAYSAEVKDKKPLDEWLKLSPVYRGKNFEHTFKKLDISQLLSWYEKQGNISSFDKVKFLEQYAEFKK